MKSKTRKAAGKASLDPLVLPCPFCGAPAKFTNIGLRCGATRATCRVFPYLSRGEGLAPMTRDMMIAEWNRRAETVVHAAARALLNALGSGNVVMQKLCMDNLAGVLGQNAPREGRATRD